MSFYTSLTGLQAATTELSVTSNNIANAGHQVLKPMLTLVISLRAHLQKRVRLQALG